MPRSRYLVRIRDGQPEVISTPVADGWDHESRRWVNWQNERSFDRWCEKRGWAQLSESAIPDPTALTVLESRLDFVDGSPIKVWFLRDKTLAEIELDVEKEAAAEHQNEIEETIANLPELAARVAELPPSMNADQKLVRDSFVGDTAADLGKLELAISQMATLLGDNTTIGSIRSWRASLSNPPKTAELRSLADLLIDQTRANRRIARQTLRLARAMASNYTTADVGSDL